MSQDLKDVSVHKLKDKKDSLAEKVVKEAVKVGYKACEDGQSLEEALEDIEIGETRES